MIRQQVNSSALSSVGYDSISKVLELEFKANDGVWQYLKFSPTAYKKFINADSLGNFFVTRIKGKYAELKIS